jgi:hypothetical protein
MAEMPSATLAMDSPFISFHRHRRIVVEINKRSIGKVREKRYSAL